jgi:dTDP-4-dehydrorhamnose 3,5-epimerase
MIDPKKHWLVEDARRDRQSITRDWAKSDVKLIDGVIHRETRPVMTNYGYLVEMYRAEWFSVGDQKIDQVFMSCLAPRALSAWHAHGETTDRIFIASGSARIVLFDGREGSPTRGTINEFRVGSIRPALLVIPPRVWHGVQNVDTTEPLVLLNAVDQAYRYEEPDHWRVPPDSPSIPYAFER